MASKIKRLVNRYLVRPVLVLTVLAIGCSLSNPTRPRTSFYLGGIQINETDQQRWFAALERAGMDTVAVTVCANLPALYSGNKQIEERMKSEHHDDEAPILTGLLYWKHSTEQAHHEIEPFVHALNAANDPLGDELRRFREDETWRSRLASILSGI